MEEKKKYNILYIDDEPDNLQVFRSAFRRDYNVITTTSAREAIEVVEQEEVPVIITDQRMPEISGVELLKKLPTDLQNVRIILTGFSDVEVIIEAINSCHIYRYITKPWDKAELKLTIDNALNKYFLQQDNRKLLQELKEANEQLEEKIEIRTRELNLEKERTEQLLLNILPKETAEELRRRGKVRPRRYTDVTLLFVDIAGFTQIAERTDPEDLIEELDYYYKVFDNIVSKYGVEKIKTIGDAYLAVCGVPSPKDEHAVKTVQAALEIMNFVNREQAHRERVGRVFFEIRIGIHSGEVISGVVGLTKFAYDVWGDDVNLAARIENSGEKGRINISESTYTLIKGRFNCTHRGKIPAKNKGEIDMYFVEIE